MFLCKIIKRKGKKLKDLHVLFNKYDDKLTLEQISEGIYLCIENALNLFGDAYVLQKAKRFPRALSLLLVAIQEAGKVNILENMVTISTGDQKRWKKEWQNFRKHKIKDSLGYSIKISSDFHDSPGEAFWQQLLYIKNFASSREKVRQLGLYIDYIAGDKKWWSPNEIIEDMVKIAENEVVQILYKLYRKKELGLFSVKALRIYREEFENFHPEIEFNKEYEIEDFGNRFFGLKGPYKKYWNRLVKEGVINKIPDDLTISGKHWKEFIYGKD
ncbi:hypothetical protein ES707_21784 [subsurface metagenome]